MKSCFSSAAFVALSSAALIRRDQCCFQITATGGVSGVMGQLGDGQNRLNGTYSAATYCYSNGGITDANGRGCIVTTTNDATHQFQCDQGTAAQAGFSIGANGSLSFDGDDQFYACPYNNGDIIEYNVYTQELAGQDKCRPVNLSTGGKCATSGSTCSMATTTIYATAEASISTQSVPDYSSAFSSITTETSVAATEYVWSSEALPTPESTASLTPVPAYFSSSGFSTSVSASVQISTSTFESSASQPTYSSVAPVATSSMATVPAYNSQCTATAPSYETSIETTVVESTFSSVQSISTSPSSAVVVSVPATSAVPSSIAVSVPTYTATSECTSTWVTVPSISASASMSTTASSTAIPSTYYEASTTTTATSTSASVCQTALTGAYQTPHLIVPISSNSPDTAYGTQYFAYVDSENSTIFNFDIPSSYEGMTCTTIFLFPEIADLETSSYTFSGSGDLVFSELSAAATEQTTYDTAPAVASVLNTIAIASGSSYVVTSGSCAAGTTVGIELGSQSGLSLEFFEDWNPSSLGLYITAC